MLEKLNRRLKTLGADPRGSIMILVTSVLDAIGEMFSTAWTYLIAWCWGVSLGRKIRFVGIPHFIKLPTSRIVVGDGCVFRSSPTSNPLGVNHPCMIKTFSKETQIVIGNGCGFSGTSILSIQSIQIGNNVLFGPNTSLMDGDGHSLMPGQKIGLGFGEQAPIMIEDNVWIGANVFIFKGVTIGKNTVVGANSVVTHSLPPNVLAAGTPARVIRQLEA